jgi:hypothetical protein
VTSSIQSPADVVNAALVHLGSMDRIGNLYDGSLVSKKALDIYGQTRDALMINGDWEFLERNTNGILLKQAPSNYLMQWTPANPPQPWLYEYSYPGDALKIRAVKPTVVFVPNFDPQPWTYSIDNDNSFSPPQRVILTNVPNAIIVYTGRVTDPTTWNADFTEEFILELAKKLAPGLKGLDIEKILIPEAGQAQQSAASRQE